MEITTSIFHKEMKRLAVETVKRFEYDLDEPEDAFQAMLDDLDGVLETHEWAVDYDKAFEMLKVCPNPDVVFEITRNEADAARQFFTFINLAAFSAMKSAVRDYVASEHVKMLEKYSGESMQEFIKCSVKHHDGSAFLIDVRNHWQKKKLKKAARKAAEQAAYEYWWDHDYGSEGPIMVLVDGVEYCVEVEPTVLFHAKKTKK